VRLKCLVMQHKWRPAEETNEYGLRLACVRCGKVRSVGGGGAGESANAAAELAGRRGGA
jgi:hypothetical protein